MRLSLVACFLLCNCYALYPSSGGAQTRFEPPRRVDRTDVAVPEGYRVEVVATGLTFPTGIVFDDADRAHVVESGYSYGEMWTKPRLLRLEADGRLVVVAEGAKNGPWTGATWHDGAFWVAEGGELEGGRILRILPDGRTSVLAEGLPSRGDHHTNGPVFGPDGFLYFGQGTVTNAGVVGTDNFDFGWLTRFPKLHDVPCEDVTLAGTNFASEDPLAPGGISVTTGAFVPFGTPTPAGTVIAGRVPCNGAVMRVRPEGGPVELVAWGFRNPFGLAFAPSGDLYVTDNGYDDRGSRRIWGTADVLWRVERGAWYGWPDFAEGVPLTSELFEHPKVGRAQPLLARAPRQPPRPVARLEVHASADGLDFSRSERFGWVGHAFIAELGDETPAVGKLVAPVGFKVVRVNVLDGSIHEFAVNRGERPGPASVLGNGGLERPVAARFDRSGAALYVVDFGVMTHDEEGAQPRPGTGVIWRIVREEGVAWSEPSH